MERGREGGEGRGEIDGEREGGREGGREGRGKIRGCRWEREGKVKWGEGESKRAREWGGHF